MSDFVRNLRDFASDYCTTTYHDELVRDAADAIEARDAEIERLRAELAAARAESALQPNYSCEHDGCAMREDSGYKEQARKYVDEYYRMKEELAAEQTLRQEHQEQCARNIATLRSLLRGLMQYLPRKRRIGGVENGYNVSAGEALLALLDKCEAALGETE